MPLSIFPPPCRIDAPRLLILSVVALCGVGCGGPSSVPPLAPPVTQRSPDSAQAPVALPATEPSTSPPRQLVREAWDVNLMNGAKVGYSHFEEFSTWLGEQPVRELISNNEMSIQRFGQTVTQSIQAKSIETLDGQILRFGTTMLSGESELTILGEFKDGKMMIEAGTLGKTQMSSLVWNPSWGGFFADQQSLKQQPMRPGEERQLIALVPGMAQVGEIAIKAIQKEPVMLLGEERELLRIESFLNVAGTKIKSILWADEAGEVLKMSVPGLGHETYRTTKEIALRPNEGAEFDLGRQTVVKVDTALPAPHSTNRVVYRVRLANGSPAETFSNCRSQSVKKIDDRTAEITVRAIRPESAAAATGDSGAPTKADLQPNSLIQSDDGAIISLAERFAEGQTDPWTLAKTFESRVRDYVQSKSFSQAISSAADVVRSKEGD